jgi:hypothetical protein
MTDATSEEIESLKTQVQKLTDTVQTISIELERQKQKWAELERELRDLSRL